MSLAENKDRQISRQRLVVFQPYENYLHFISIQELNIILQNKKKIMPLNSIQITSVLSQHTNTCISILPKIDII